MPENKTPLYLITHENETPKYSCKKRGSCTQGSIASETLPFCVSLSCTNQIELGFYSQGITL